MTTSTLLPLYEGLHIDGLASEPNAIVVRVSTVAATARCPRCGQTATRVHSRYPRTLADLPWNQVAVRIQVKSRKFFCDQQGCPRRVFTEPLPQLAQRYAHKTLRLNAALHLIGYALGGEAGARIAVELGLAASPDTLLNRVRQEAAEPVAQAPLRAVGVDDFALRKGQHYGTILVDLDNHRLVDLLPDRSAESLAEWLKAHPEIEIVSRDRASAYSEGSREGAPQAKQVADRFHLVQNLVEALQRMLLRYQKPLQEAGQQVSATDAAPVAASVATTALPPAPAPQPAIAADPPLEGEQGASSPTAREQERQTRRHNRKDRYEQVVEWHKQGVSIQQIARNLKMHRRTVRQWLQATEFPERCAPPPRSSQHHPFDAYLRQRWAAGYHNAAQLFRELQERGFTGSQSALRRYLLAWRDPLPEALQDRRGRKGELVPPPVCFSARTTAWLLLGYAKSKDTRQHRITEAYLQTLKTICPAIAQAQELAREFFTLVRERQGTELKAWIAKVWASDLAELKSFARGLTSDYDAVFAGVSTEVSNGQTEGQVNRLKLIKRAMYGRAKFDLLKARVLPRRAAA